MVRLTLYYPWMWYCLAKHMCSTTHFLFIAEVKLSESLAGKSNTYILWNMTWDAKEILVENLTYSLLDSIRCDMMDWFHMKTQFHSLPIFIEHQCDSLEMRKCSITNFLLVMEQDVMRLSSNKHCIVTHILLVMGWDMMRLLVANAVVSLTDCLYGMRCIKTATGGKTAVHSPTIGYRIRCISISWHSITHMLS